MNDAMIITSPIRSKRHRFGLGRSPAKSCGITLPSLTLPYSGKRVSMTASVDDSTADLSPRPPSTIRNCIQRLRVRYASTSKNDMKCKKSPAGKSPAKPSKSPGKHMTNNSIASPNFKEHHTKQMSMLKFAVEDQGLGNDYLSQTQGYSTITALLESERSNRISHMVQEQDGRTAFFRLFIGVEAKAMRSNLSAFALLEEQEEFVRGDIVGEMSEEWTKKISLLTESLWSALLSFERTNRIQVLQEEMSQRALLFGFWLGQDSTASNVAEERFKRDEILTDEAFMRDQWMEREGYFRKFTQQTNVQSVRQLRADEIKLFTSKKNVLLESEETMHFRIIQLEESERKSLLEHWLTTEKLPERPPSDARPVHGLRPRKSPSPVDVCGISIKVDECSSKIHTGQINRTTLKSALLTATSAILLSEESNQMELMAVEKKERGSLKIALSPRRLRQRPFSRNVHPSVTSEIPKPPPYEPSQVLSQYADNPRLYRAMLRVLAKEMALTQQHSQITRQCDERSELAERHRLVFKFWKAVQSPCLPLEEQLSMLFEEESMSRHAFEMQEDNNIILTFWKRHSIFEKNLRHERWV